jgi:phytoene dehydrogenase-like protein
MLRPVPHSAQYASPVNGLFLCGAGSHPGGGVMGSAGRNAAHAVLGAKDIEGENS